MSGSHPTNTTTKAVSIGPQIHFILFSRRPTVKQLLKLPAVQKALKRRQAQLDLAELVQTVKHWCAPLVLLAFWIWTYVCVIPSQKVKTLAEKIFGGDHGKKTPPNSILSPDHDNFKVTAIVKK